MPVAQVDFWGFLLYNPSLYCAPKGEHILDRWTITAEFSNGARNGNPPEALVLGGFSITGF